MPEIYVKYESTPPNNHATRITRLLGRCKKNSTITLHSRLQFLLDCEPQCTHPLKTNDGLYCSYGLSIFFFKSSFVSLSNIYKLAE